MGEDPLLVKFLRKVLGGGARVDDDGLCTGVTGRWGDGGPDMFCIYQRRVGISYASELK